VFWTSQLFAARHVSELSCTRQPMSSYDVSRIILLSNVVLE